MKLIIEETGEGIELSLKGSASDEQLAEFSINAVATILATVLINVENVTVKEIILENVTGNLRKNILEYVEERAEHKEGPHRINHEAKTITDALGYKDEEALHKAAKQASTKTVEKLTDEDRLALIAGVVLLGKMPKELMGDVKPRTKAIQSLLDNTKRNKDIMLSIILLYNLALFKKGMYDD